MKLHTSARAPNPRRVDMFLAEKGRDMERVLLDLNAQQHKSAEFRAKNPITRVPVLELDDGRLLPESRAICSYLESLYPQPNLMGADAVDRLDKGTLEVPQFPDFGASQLGKLSDNARWLDDRLATQAFVAGERFTIADITAFCAIEFARLLKWRPADEGLPHLAAWRDRIAARPSAQ
jgi:glutathione S-transferase